MTLEDAMKVAAIIEKADGGCTVCVGDLVEDLNHYFKEIEWSTNNELAYKSGYVSVRLRRITDIDTGISQDNPSLGNPL